MRQNDFRHLKYTSIIDLLLWCHKYVCDVKFLKRLFWLTSKPSLKAVRRENFFAAGKYEALRNASREEVCEQLVCKRCSIVSVRPPTNLSPTRLQSSRGRRNTLRMKACSQAKVVYVAFLVMFLRKLSVNKACLKSVACVIVYSMEWIIGCEDVHTIAHIA